MARVGWKRSSAKAAARNMFVLDGSVTLAWYFKDEATAYTNAVRDSLAAATALVPALWPLEVANALVMGEGRGRATSADAAAWVNLLTGLPIRVEASTAGHVMGAVLDLARASGLTVYDAAYLELAMRRGLPLATLDGRLQAASRAVGVKAYRP
jgi:predicted nucleic acid-binding protein